MLHLIEADLSQPLLSRHRLAVEDFHKMAAAGIFNNDSRIELVEGELLDMAPIGSLHAGTVTSLAQWFILSSGGKFRVSIQNPVRLGKYSELQPDIALLKPRQDGYTTSHPTPPEIMLLVEISDSTLRYDREVKVPLYARYGIVETWLVNLQEPRLEVYRALMNKKYQKVDYHHFGQVCLHILPDVAIDVGALLFQAKKTILPMI